MIPPIRIACPSLAFFVLASLGCQPSANEAAGQDDVATLPGARGDETPAQAMDRLWADWNDPVKQKVEPFRVFDNLSYVGIDFASAWVIETSEGLILIDTLWGDWVTHIEDGIRALGLDPNDIEIVLATHAHFDHHGGNAHFKKTYGAQVGMTEADWQLSEQEPSDPRFAAPAVPRDLVLADGDTVTLGDTTITTYVTPGHTEGVLSLDFEVRDGSDTYRAFTFGGVGLNFSTVARTESYLESVARIRALNAEGERRISVNVSNHAGVGQVFARRDQLAARAGGDPHPFVDPEGYVAWLDRIEAAAEEKLEQEKAAEAAADAEGAAEAEP